jgi:methylated-DNA-[protein]-cysteine S-methyltransferase
MTVPTDLDRRFREAAVRANLLDAGYDVVDSPIGPLLVAASSNGVLRISFERGRNPGATLEQIARVAGPRVLRAPQAIDTARHELDEYFEGRRRAFDVSLDLRGMTAFTAGVLAELADVPYGQTATYSELARRVGKPRAARAVGTVMHNNPLPIVLPCHRIVGVDGSLTGYGGGLDAKEHLLRLEGAIL